MIQFNELFKPITLYNGVYIKVLYELKYKSLSELLDKDNELYENWIKQYPDNSSAKYLSYAYKYFDYVELTGIVLCTLSPDGEKINRSFAKFIGSPSTIINKFNDYMNQKNNSNMFYVGYDLQYEFSILLRYMIKHKITIPQEFRDYLDMKPWENKFFLDIKYCWKMGDIYGSTSLFNQMINFLELPKSMDIVPMNELTQLNRKTDMERILKMGMAYTNAYAQIIKEFRVQGI